MIQLITANFFSPGQPGYYLLIFAFMAGLVLLFIWSNHRNKDTSRAAQLGWRYREMDPEKLASVPDEELVDAVVANILEKLDKRRPDPYKDVPLMSRGRCAVYSIWITCKELDESGFEDYFAGPSLKFCDLAADGLELVNAPLCANALREASPLAMNMEENTERLAELHADFVEAMEAEQPLKACVDYIRSNPEEFIDPPQEDGALPPTLR